MAGKKTIDEMIAERKKQREAAKPKLPEMAPMNEGAISGTATRIQKTGENAREKDVARAGEEHDGNATVISQTVVEREVSGMMSVPDDMTTAGETPVPVQPVAQATKEPVAPPAVEAPVAAPAVELLPKEPEPVPAVAVPSVTPVADPTDIANNIMKQLSARIESILGPLKKEVAGLKTALEELTARVGQVETDTKAMENDMLGTEAEGDTSAVPGLMEKLDALTSRVDTAEKDIELIGNDLQGTEADGENPAVPGLLDRMDQAEDKMAGIEGEAAEFRGRLFGENEKEALDRFGDAPVIVSLADGVTEAMQSLNAVDTMAGPNHERAAAIAADNVHLTKEALVTLFTDSALTVGDVIDAAKERGPQTVKEQLEALRDPVIAKATLLAMNKIEPEHLDKKQKEMLDNLVKVVTFKAEKLLDAKEGVNWDELIGGDA